MKDKKMMKQSKAFQLNELKYENVRITDSILQNAFRLELKYLTALDIDRLLAGFLETAGLTPKAEKYSGWESTEIQGHTLGHYLTALSQAYGETKDEDLRKKIDYLLSELDRSQLKDGYLFASPSELFDRVENKKPVWVPWYTMHKIMGGLIAAYQFTESKLAYDIMTRLGFWIYKRCMAWKEETRNIVLSVEYGGMNDCLYDLYLETGDERFAQAAHRFDEIPLFQDIYEKKDVLNGLHANATIPKIIGAVKRYVALGKTEDFYLKVGEDFWDIVINHHTYITGGNSEWEHFGEPDILDDERTACNCETCNTYNMLKLTKLLYMITKEKKYADYYERAFINAILSSQNPQTGMTTYFQPMATGFFKVYSTPFDRFWCCTGSGMENFTKLTEGIYFTEKNRIYINRFIHSEVDISEYKLTLKVECNLLESEIVKIRIERLISSNDDFEIAVRIPKWVKESPKVLAGDVVIESREEKGYLILKSEWKEKHQFEITFPMGIDINTLPDNENVISFAYGPFVLSAGLGKQMQDTTVTGVDVLVPKKELMIKDYIVLQDVDISKWKNNMNDYLKKTPNKMEFVLKNWERNRELIFTPYFARHEERYGIYFKLFQNQGSDFKHYREKVEHKWELAKNQLDTIPIGNDQYELAHMIKGEKTDTSRVDGHRCRYAKEDGWFSYQLKLTKVARKLCVTYYSDDEGNKFDIYLNDKLYTTETIQRVKTRFYTVEYHIVDDIQSGSNTVTVKFQNKGSEFICRIFDELYIKK